MPMKLLPRRFSSLLIALIVTLFATNFCFALSNTNDNANHNANDVYVDWDWNPLQPRFYVDSSVSNIGAFKGDVMFPIYGNAANFFFFDALAGCGTDDAWLKSGGFGFRSLVHAILWGAYIFADYNESQNNKSFWVVNPGVEFYNNDWDAHLNGYIPKYQRDKTLMHNILGMDLGTTRFVSFDHHSQFDALFDRKESIGKGADFEVGYGLPTTNHARVFAGYYYYDPKYTDSIHGAVGGLDIPYNRNLSMRIEGSYDDAFHGTARFTMRYNFRGIPPIDQEDAQDRALAPIERHIGTLRTGAGIPIRKSFVNTGRQALTLGNIWFFTNASTTNYNAANGTNQCTAANPCSGSSFNQVNVISINTFAPLTNFYFTPGTYMATNGNPPMPTDALGLTLNWGQSVYGRNSDYRSRVKGNDRPIFYGGFVLNGENTLDSIKVERGNTAVQTGLDANNAQGVFIHNTAIGDPNLAAGMNGYFRGALIRGNSKVKFEYSQIAAQDFFLAAGLDVQNTSDVHLIDTQISSTTPLTAAFASIGIITNHTATVNLENSRITASGFNADALNAFGNSMTTIRNSYFTVTGTNLARGIRTFNNTIINLLSSNVNVNATVNATGASINNNSVVNLTNSKLSSTGGTTAVGIDAVDATTTANLKRNSTVAANSATGTATATQGAGTINDDGTSTCTENGTNVPC